MPPAAPTSFQSGGSLFLAGIKLLHDYADPNETALSLCAALRGRVLCSKEPSPVSPSRALSWSLVPGLWAALWPMAASLASGSWPMGVQVASC